MAVNITKHRRRDVDRENVVGIGEETDTGNADNLNVEPTTNYFNICLEYSTLSRYIRELGVVNLCKSSAPTLVEVDRTLRADDVLFLERLRGGHGRL